jgi:hypothetical protein
MNPLSLREFSVEGGLAWRPGRREILIVLLLALLRQARAYTEELSALPRFGDIAKQF